MRKNLLAACLIWVLAAVQGPPAAAGFDDGAEAYIRGDYAAALAVWRPLAMAGDAAAQLRVGEMFRDRQGVRWRDFEGAAAMFRLAAAQGLPDAQFALGRLHYEGRLVPRDTREMLSSLIAAARQRHAAARITLGVVYEYGLDGISPNLTEAYKWYDLAAASGAPALHDKLAKLHARISAKMTAGEIADAIELAQAWHPSEPAP